MVDDSAALYACRVVAASKLTKDIAVVGPPDIGFNKDTGEFEINIPKKDANQYKAADLDGAFYNAEDPRLLQIYVTTLQKADKIPYGAPSNDRIKVADLQLAFTVPLEQIPDPRVVIEDAADYEKEEREKAIAQKRELEMEQMRLAEKEVQKAE